MMAMIYVADAVGSILLLTRRPLIQFHRRVNVKIADEKYQPPADAIEALARHLLPASGFARSVAAQTLLAGIESAYIIDMRI